METAASIIAVVQVSEKVIRYIRDVSGATEDRKRLREQVRACSNILSTLRDGIEDSEEGQEWGETIELLASPLMRLQTVLELAAVEFQAKASVKEKLKWPFKEKEVQILMAAIENEKGLLVLALENNAARLLHEINVRSKKSDARLMELTKELKIHVAAGASNATEMKETMATVRDAQAVLHVDFRSLEKIQEQQRLAEKRLKILAWLSRVDQFTQQHDKASTWQAGTCTWFLKLETYQAWSKESNDSTLFCPGMPGAGKTVLTSIVIADLWARYNHEANVAVTFFFCEFTRQADQTVDGILLSIPHISLSTLLDKTASRAWNGPAQIHP